MDKGKIYFYTATINNWLPVLDVEDCKNVILDSLEYLNVNGAVDVFGFVIMPNHIHILWKINENGKAENVQLKFMKYTAQQIKFYLERMDNDLLNKLVVNKRDRIYQIWQRNPLAFEINNPTTFEQKLDYIHNNPCQGKWMLADEPVKYKYSSAAFYELDDTGFNFLKHYKEFV